MGFPPNSSAKMQPIDHTSIAVVCKINQSKLETQVETYIIGEAEHDLGRSVPSSGHVFCHETLVAG
jgi:hypothetical protein